MQDIACRLYVADQVRELDRRAIANGIPGYTLMQRAAAACWHALQQQTPAPRRLAVVCGVGNNGGDGYEIARLARAAGGEVLVFAIGEARGGDAVIARAAWLADGGEIHAFEQQLPEVDWVADAVLGTGLSRPPDSAASNAIHAINTARERGARVLAVDLPSGLDGSSGHAPGDCVHADLSVSFIGNKLGLWTGRGPEVAGQRLFDTLQVPESTYAALEPEANLQSAQTLTQLGRRARDAHKSSSGHVLVIGGNHGMAGAVLLAAQAALRAGAGLVSVATRPAHAAALTAAQPELMVHGIDGPQQLDGLLARASVVVLGPGLGQDEWARALFARLIAGDHALVLDADALNLLARLPRRRENWVLTPHPGEAARLLQCTSADVQADRLGALRRLQARYGGAIILKGAGTLVSGAPVEICPYGNPGMAVAGMGDTLTGIIASFWAQRGDPADAARLGVLTHARAGDAAAVAGERGMLPSDLIAALRGIVNPP